MSIPLRAITPEEQYLENLASIRVKPEYRAEMSKKVPPGDHESRLAYLAARKTAEPHKFDHVEPELPNCSGMSAAQRLAVANGETPPPESMQTRKTTAPVENGRRLSAIQRLAIANGEDPTQVSLNKRGKV